MRWRRSGVQPGEAEIEAIERRFEIVFPSDYRKHMKETNGGVPEASYFGTGATGEVAMIYRLEASSDSELIREFEFLNEDLLRFGLLPIGIDRGGARICLSIDDENPGVFLWEGSLGDGVNSRNTTRIGESFETFIASLAE